MPKLGLAIVDEEHRFGVRKKERVKQLRSRVDVLALSATPIPRSLSMALDGLRDLSLMATPPPNRLAVRTFVAKDSDRTVREALARELARGGQVFCLHHRVQTIGSAVERMRFLAPGAQIAVVHARLPRVEIEAAMRGFYAGEIDILVCSTIIESGIDVPNANTIIVTHADRFGMAQMHQLRGRVGRAGRQAYAYFLAALDSIATPARERLRAIGETSQLGGGHLIAMRDLEIRGAGELLGTAQSGAVADVGIETFRNMVKRASKLQRGEAPGAQAAVDLGCAACLPADYCPSPVERMRLYRSFASAAELDEIEQLRTLLADRFGALPSAARMLAATHRLRIIASELGITGIRPAATGLLLSFAARPQCAEALLAAAASRRDCRIQPDQTLLLSCGSDAAARAAAAAELLDLLGRPVAQDAAAAAA